MDVFGEILDDMAEGDSFEEAIADAIEDTIEEATGIDID
jgi:hypothetical protein